jgi:1-acyl-sn-glycerol-3-phosphate acyltransferase
VSAGHPEPTYSARWFGLFGRYLRRYFVRHFDGVRIVPPGPPELGAAPTVFYANHPSWWDPVLFMLLADTCYPSRQHFGPMDEAALGGYGFFRRLGVFAVEQGTARGARQFLRGSRAALAGADGTLWLTPHGRFCDSRSRESLQAGVAHLADIDGCQFVPLAIEYVFWNERLPEVLVEFGSPRAAADLPREADARLAALQQDLETTQENLAARAQTRDPDQFETLLSGTTGVGGTYDRWRRLRALLRGRRFEASHAAAGAEKDPDDTVRAS